MKLSFEMIQQFSSTGHTIALNAHQLRLLGIGSPPPKGWIGRIVGKEISQSTYDLVMELRAQKRRAVRKAILESHGVNGAQLFQTKL